MVLSNPGSETLGWELTTRGIDGLTVTPSAGTLAAQGLEVLTVSFSSSQTQARGDAYLGNITLSAVSGTCKCREQQVSVAVSLGVTATPSAALSKVTLLNPGKIATSGSVQFLIDAIDSTGLALLDAADVAYFAVLTHPRSSRRRLEETKTTTCSVSYTATTQQHIGTCDLPDLITGTFTVNVTDIQSESVGVLSVPVSRCEAGSYADDEGECKACSKRLDCSATGVALANLKIKPGSYRWSADSEVVRDCRMGARACPGGNGTGAALCARGYSGPLCGVCSKDFILSGSKCIECASGRAVASLTTPLLVVSAVIAVGVLATCTDVLKPLFEYVWLTCVFAILRLCGVRSE